MIVDALLRRPNVDSEGAKRPEKPSVSATVVALEATRLICSSLSSSLAHNSSFSPMDVSDKLDERLLRRRWRVGRPVVLPSSMSLVVDVSDKFDERLLRRRWRVGRPVVLPSSMSLVVPMERKGDLLAGGWLGSDCPPFTTKLSDINWSRALSMSSLLVSPPVVTLCLLLRSFEEEKVSVSMWRQTSFNIGR